MLTLSGKLYAQDPYFSQYFMSPMSNNPAMIGKGISDMRVLVFFLIMPTDLLMSINFKHNLNMVVLGLISIYLPTT